MTGEDWDVHWWRIYLDAVRDGEGEENAAVLADHDTVEQFGPRPEAGA